MVRFFVNAAVSVGFFVVLGFALLGCTPPKFRESAQRLVVQATGESLGVWVKGTVAVDPATGYRVDFARPVVVYVESNAFDCRLGDAVLSVADRAGEDAYITPDGNLVQLNTAPNTDPVSFVATAVLSVTPAGVACDNLRLPLTVVGRYYHWVEDDNGAVLRTSYAPADLVVER